MKKWTDSHVRGPIDEMEKFKAKVENMPIVDFVNQKTKLLDQAKKLSSLDVEDYKDTQDPDFVKGEFLFKNYLARKNSSDEYYLSETPKIVEGISYKFALFPNGCSLHEGTHIAVGI
jgi:hypothetical protein